MSCISRYIETCNIAILYRDIVNIFIDHLFLNKPQDDGATQSEDDSDHTIDATQSEDTENDRTLHVDAPVLPHRHYRGPGGRATKHCTTRGFCD